jgi:uncharacterized iron-regulated membrane protein
MKPLRTVIFWAHLAAGATAGLVVLVMSVTGVALTYEKQLIERADRGAWTAPAAPGATHLPPETLLARVAEARRDAAPIAVTLRSDPSAPATVTLEGNKALLVDPYSGAILGEPPVQPRAFFRTMTVWHRYLALEGASRATGKAITGAANLTFLFIVVSGIYLWVPRVWNRIQFRRVLWFRRGLAGKARDFNWHNTIGFWSAVPLAIVVAGAVPISYPWASNLVYRVAGDTPPAPVAPSPATPAASPLVLDTRGLNAAWETAVKQAPDWRTLTTRAAAPEAPITVVVDRGYAGQPQKRVTLAVDRATSGVIKAEGFEDLSAGRRARSWLRFAHTGEYYGLLGQTVAGLATAGGIVLVYTGFALALRRLWSWIQRRRATADDIDQKRAA